MSVQRQVRKMHRSTYAPTNAERLNAWRDRWKAYTERNEPSATHHRHHPSRCGPVSGSHFRSEA